MMRYLVGIDVNLAFGAAANGAAVSLSKPPVHVTDPAHQAGESRGGPAAGQIRVSPASAGR